MAAQLGLAVKASIAGSADVLGASCSGIETEVQGSLQLCLTGFV